MARRGDPGSSWSARWVTLLGTLAMLVIATGARAQDCPESLGSFVTVAGWFSTAAAVFDTSTGMSGSESGARVRFDFPAGELEVYRCCGLGVTATRAIDRFDVTGVPPGTPVVARADLVIDGMILGLGCGASGCYGDLRGTVTQGTTSYQLLLTAQVTTVDSVQASGLVPLVVTFVAGAPLTIEFMLEAYRAAGGNNGAHGIGRIRFTGLPAGVGVVSCKGYRQTSVATRAESWGRVKTRYR